MIINFFFEFWRKESAYLFSESWLNPSLVRVSKQESPRKSNLIFAILLYHSVFTRKWNAFGNRNDKCLNEEQN